MKWLALVCLLTAFAGGCKRQPAPVATRQLAPPGISATPGLGAPTLGTRGVEVERRK